MLGVLVLDEGGQWSNSVGLVDPAYLGDPLPPPSGSDELPLPVKKLQRNFVHIFVAGVTTGKYLRSYEFSNVLVD